MNALTKTQIIEALSRFVILGEGKIIIKEIDYSKNLFAPEPLAYRIHFTDFTGKCCKTTYYPTTVGFQG